MSRYGLRLTVYFGERDRAQGTFLADRIMDVLTIEGIEGGVMLRGSEGFGLKHHLQSSNLLSLSEDLPMIAVAIGEVPVVEGAATALRELGGHGLLTLEPVLLGCGGDEGGAGEKPNSTMSIWLSRGDRIDRRPAYRAVVDLLRQHGADSATVLLGVDGVASGRRRRAGFFSLNRKVPLIVSAGGSGTGLAAAAQEIAGLMPSALIETGPTGIEPGPNGHRRLTISGTDCLGSDGRPLHSALVRRIREAGGRGATVLSGIYGFTGASEPRGDSLFQLRRQVPVLTEVVDSAADCERWQALARELDGAGMRLTSRPVRIPAE